MDPELLRQWLPIGISILSLLLAGFALGWNVYRDIILKARVRVQFAIVSIVGSGQQIDKAPRYLRIAVVNHGPGPVTVQTIAGQQSPLWRQLARRPQHFVVINDYSNPLSQRLPHKLELGDSLNLFLPYDRECFLAEDVTHIGVTDSYGRVHYASARDVRTAHAAFRRDFPPKP